MRTRPTSLLGILQAFYGSTLLNFQMNLTSSARIMNLVVAPAVFAFLSTLMLRESPDATSIYYAVIGSSLGVMWIQMLGMATFFVHWQRQAGTLELILGSPAPLPVILGGYLFAEVLMALASMLLSFVVVFALVGKAAVIQAPVSFLISIGVGSAGFMVAGMLAAAVMTISRFMPQWVNALGYPMWILAGFLFPITVLPAWVRPLSYLLPPYWTARALYRAASGATPWELRTEWGLTLALSLVYLWLVFPIFRVVTRRIRVTAEITLH